VSEERTVVEMPVVEELNEASGTAEVNGDTYLQLVNAAVEAGYHPNYMGKLANEGQVPAVRDGRKRIWIRKADLDTFAAERAEAKEARRARGGSGGGRSAYNKANYMPPKVRAYKTVLNEMRKDETLPAEVREPAVEWIRGRFQELAAEYAAKREAAEADAEAAETDESFQEELES